MSFFGFKKYLKPACAPGIWVERDREMERFEDPEAVFPNPFRHAMRKFSSGNRIMRRRR